MIPSGYLMDGQVLVPRILLMQVGWTLRTKK